MTQKMNIVLVDDLDGSPATETVRFGLDGSSYVLDLSADNAAALRRAVDPYVVVARRVGGTSKPVPLHAGNRPFDSVDPRAVRAWAASNKVPLPARGRIPAGVLQQFRAAGH